MSFSGRVPDQGAAGQELARLVAELRALEWVPVRADAMTS